MAAVGLALRIARQPVGCIVCQSTIAEHKGAFLLFEVHRDGRDIMIDALCPECVDDHGHKGAVLAAISASQQEQLHICRDDERAELIAVCDHYRELINADKLTTPPPMSLECFVSQRVSG